MQQQGNQRAGKVVLVGAGPGDPGLLTLAGARALAEAEAVVYDALAPAATLRHAPPGAELHYAGKRAGRHALSQDQINALIVELASTGKRVVRLKGGDPFVFGRGAEEALACRAAGISFAVIPGVSSALAAPAYAGIPVTHRQLAENALILTGHEAGESTATDWAFAARADTLVILMGASSLAANMANLAAAGKPLDTPVACVQWGTRADQAVVIGTVGTVAEVAATAGLGSPMAIVIGPVAALASQLGWFEPGPLAGQRVVVTRARPDASSLASRLEALGAQVLEAPVIGIRGAADTGRLAAELSSHPAWLVLTSRPAVHALVESLRSRDLDVRALANIRLAAIGQSTVAALAATGLRADFAPARPTSTALAAELPLTPGDRVVLALSSLADDTLEAGLANRGAVTTRITAYENVPESLTDQQRRDVLESHVITFTSASTARNLQAALGDSYLGPDTRLVSIGPRTSDAVRAAFGRVDHEAASPSVDALVDAVLEAVP